MLLEYLSDAGMIPPRVLAECIRGLDVGTPARGPTVEAMARRVDQATGGSTAISLYKAYYRPASTFAVHAGAGSLLRHVSWDDRITRRPQRTWARRSPVPIADACFGLLTAAVAQQAGTPHREAVRYADRHGGRALTPVMIMGTSGLKRSIGLRKLMTALEQLRSFGDYIQSGADAQNPDVRTAKIREGMKSRASSGGARHPCGRAGSVSRLRGGQDRIRDCSGTRMIIPPSRRSRALRSQ